MSLEFRFRSIINPSRTLLLSQVVDASLTHTYNGRALIAGTHAACRRRQRVRQKVWVTHSAFALSESGCGSSREGFRVQMAANSTQVPEVVVQRLPLYVRALTQMSDDGITVVSSQQLGSGLQMTPAQIRKDLSYFGRFGKQGRGYNVDFLLTELGQILGLDRTWRACLIGVGRLGRAIINYPGFAPEGFQIVAAFDSDSTQVDDLVGGLKVMPMARLRETLAKEKIVIAIVAVPAHEAQIVIDCLIEYEVKGILNYAPVAPQVPMDIILRNVDPVLSLQSMTYYLMDEHKSSTEE